MCQRSRRKLLPFPGRLRLPNHRKLSVRFHLRPLRRGRLSFPLPRASLPVLPPGRLWEGSGHKYNTARQGRPGGNPFGMVFLFHNVPPRKLQVCLVVCLCLLCKKRMSSDHSLRHPLLLLPLFHRISPVRLYAPAEVPGKSCRRQGWNCRSGRWASLKSRLATGWSQNRRKRGRFPTRRDRNCWCLR